MGILREISASRAVGPPPVLPCYRSVPGGGYAAT